MAPWSRCDEVSANDRSSAACSRRLVGLAVAGVAARQRRHRQPGARHGRALSSSDRPARARHGVRRARRRRTARDPARRPGQSDRRRGRATRPTPAPPACGSTKSTTTARPTRPACGKAIVVVEFDGERVRSARQLTRLVQETPDGRAGEDDDHPRRRAPERGRHAGSVDDGVELPDRRAASCAPRSSAAAGDAPAGARPGVRLPLRRPAGDAGRGARGRLGRAGRDALRSARRVLRREGRRGAGVERRRRRPGAEGRPEGRRRHHRGERHGRPGHARVDGRDSPGG